MKQYEFLPLGVVNEPYRQAIQSKIDSVLDKGWYLNGEFGKQVEAQLSSLTKMPWAVTCSNGLDALRLIFRAYKELGVMRDGDEVIVQANTYIASVLAISDNGLRPVLVDADIDTLNMDFSKIEERITERTRAIMVVHLYGAPCWSDSLAGIARKHNLKIVEDNAQAIGATTTCRGLNGTGITGGLGDAAAFSFYPTKNVGAMGDAGAVTTNDEALADAVRAIANYGSDRRYHNIYQGLNCRMDELQAAVLSVKLQHLADISDTRRRNAAVYDREIANPLLRKPKKLPGNVWHQYVVLVADGRRDEFRKFLSDNGVPTDVHYAVPPHLQPCYAGLADRALPAAERIAAECVSIPIAEHLSETDISEISEIINVFR